MLRVLSKSFYLYLYGALKYTVSIFLCKERSNAYWSVYSNNKYFFSYLTWRHLLFRGNPRSSLKTKYKHSPQASNSKTTTEYSDSTPRSKTRSLQYHSVSHKYDFSLTEQHEINFPEPDKQSNIRFSQFLYHSNVTFDWVTSTLRYYSYLRVTLKWSVSDRYRYQRGLDDDWRTSTLKKPEIPRRAGQDSTGERLKIFRSWTMVAYFVLG